MTDPAPVIPVDIAEITDEQWFYDHPGRQYRLRAGMAVRRRTGRVFLRARLAGSYPYTDEAAAEAAWWRAAWPEVSPKTRAELMKAARWHRRPRQGGRPR